MDCFVVVEPLVVIELVGVRVEGSDEGEAEAEVLTESKLSSLAEEGFGREERRWSGMIWAMVAR